MSGMIRTARAAFHPIQYGLQNRMITRADGNDDLLDPMFAHYLLEVCDFAKVGHQRLQLRIRTVGLDEPMKSNPGFLRSDFISSIVRNARSLPPMTKVGKLH